MGARGFGGLDEMASCLDDSMVAFALIQISFGTGRLQRSKLVFIHFSGDNAPAIRRGRLNALKSDVVRLISHAHAYITAHQARDVSIATVIATIQQVLVLEENADADFITVKNYVAGQEKAEKMRRQNAEKRAREQSEARAARKKQESIELEDNPHALILDLYADDVAEDASEGKETNEEPLKDKETCDDDKCEQRGSQCNNELQLAEADSEGEESLQWMENRAS